MYVSILGIIIRLYTITIISFFYSILYMGLPTLATFVKENLQMLIKHNIIKLYENIYHIRL